MLIHHLAILAAIQGITEFLPVSSSGHLILVPQLTDWPDQGLVIDIAVHLGSLGAVLLYFWRDVGQAALGLVHLARFRRTAQGRLATHLIIASLPVVALGGVVAATGAMSALRSLEVIAWATLGFGVLLYLSDKLGMTLRRVEHMVPSHALAVGLAQALALIPGTSRSGITITAARFLGYERVDAARFSMLLSIPTILGAGALAGLDLAESGNLALQADALIAAGLSFVAALITIALFMRWLTHSGLTPFVLYRLALGAGLLWLVYGV